MEVGGRHPAEFLPGGGLEGGAGRAATRSGAFHGAPRRARRGGARPPGTRIAGTDRPCGRDSACRSAAGCRTGFPAGGNAWRTTWPAGRRDLTAGFLRRPAISLMRWAPAPITSSRGRSVDAGGVSSRRRRSGSSWSGPAGSRDEGVHRGVQVQTEGLGELPVTRHAAPERVERDLLLRAGSREGLGEVPGQERLHGERLHGPAVERRTRAQQRPVHHPPTGAAHHDRRTRPRTVEPVLEKAGERGVRREQIGKFVEDERPRPASGDGFAPQPFEKRSPVRVFDVVEPGEPLRYGSSEIAPLDRRRREVRDGVEAVAAGAPFEQETRLADPAAAPRWPRSSPGGAARRPTGRARQRGSGTASGYYDLKDYRGIDNLDDKDDLERRPVAV